MYAASKRYAVGQDAVAYMAVVDAVYAAQGRRAGVRPAAVRVLVQLAALRAGGAVVVAADLAACGFGEASYLRELLAEGKRAGWISSRRGKLDVLSAGRVVVAELPRAWERARRHLAGFADAAPYRARLAHLAADV